MSRRIPSTAVLLVAVAACSSSADQPRNDERAAPATTTTPPENTPPKPTAPGAEQPGAATEPATEPGKLAADPGGHEGASLWAARLGGPGQESVRDVVIDARGHVAVTGFYSSGADFGDGEAVDARKFDAYVSTYSPDGEHRWTVHFGGKGEDVGNGVAFDPQGNIVVVGLFTDEMAVGEHRLVGQGSDDAFIAKLGADGTPLWARRFGGLDSDAAHHVATSADGHILVTGSFKGSTQLAGQTLTSKGNEDIFLMELNREGKLVWIRQFGERWRDFGQRVAVDGQGNIVLLAEFTEKAAFGGDELASQGNQDLALVKLSGSGEHIWSRSFGSPFHELGLGLAVDPAGNIAITGSFDNAISFGGTKFNSQGESDVFVAKFDSTGEHLWSTAFGGPRDDIGYGVGTDKYGNVAVGGWFWQSVDFGGGPVKANGLNKDAFLLKFSAEGEYLWSRRFGDRDHDQIRGVAMSPDGRVLAAGQFRFTLQMGEQALESARKPDDRAPPADVFVAVFGP